VSDRETFIAAPRSCGTTTFSALPVVEMERLKEAAVKFYRTTAIGPLYIISDPFLGLGFEKQAVIAYCTMDSSEIHGRNAHENGISSASDKHDLQVPQRWIGAKHTY
jgi:hypothetical protein